MSRVFIQDLWLRDADDGTRPSAAAKRSLSSAKAPMKANVPDKQRTARYGRGNRWRCQWYMPVGGRHVAKTKNFRSLADAQEFQAAMEDDARRGRYHDPTQEHRLFRDVAAEWMGTKLDLKPGTKGRYEREIRVYLNPKWRHAAAGHHATRHPGMGVRPLHGRLSRRIASRARTASAEAS